MAVLENIRNRAGTLVAIIIGLSLLAFVLSDMLESGKWIFNRKKLEVAVINGKSVKIQEYQTKIEELENIYKINSGKDNIDAETVDQIMEQTWTALVKEKVMQPCYDDLGIGVSPDEMFDMVQGNNLHPIIKQLFADKQTNEVNKANIVKFLKNIDQDQTGKSKTYWLFIEKEISTDRMFSKYKNLVKQGFYTTKQQAQMSLDEKNYEVDFTYMSLKYNSIPDSTIKVSDEELEKYLEEHQNDFKQETSRDIVYVAFDVRPSDKDIQDSKEWINDKVTEFQASVNDSLFVSLNSDSPFNDKYLKKSEIQKPLDSILYNAAQGTIYGPYNEGEAFKIAKLSKIKMMPDSVRASHILIKVDQKNSKDKVHKTLDSLKTLIKAGADFGAFALKYSVDGSAQKGGDLGWFTEGKMVKPFNDACFNGNKGDLVIVDSEFGVHLIKITDRGKEIRKVQIAILERKVEPSEETANMKFAEASKFATNCRTKDLFEATASKQNLDKRLANFVKENDKNLAGIEQAREIVRWAYSVEKNEVSQVFDMNNRYIVAVLTEIREKGIPTLDQAREPLTAAVRKEKKVDMLSKKLQDQISAGKSLQVIASEMNEKVDTAKAISFASFQIPNLGAEPNIIATATSLEKNKLSQPVKGNLGVFVLSVYNSAKKENKDLAAEQNMMTQQNKQRADYQSFEAMKTIADIIDNRAKFY